uniref:Ycf21 n=2 Tax=Gracilariopsis TaxID=2781 RepID=A0A1C9CEW5_9FLOR|nr:hypothetical protein [Gracilariopsis lemaneiformis]YP_009294688.1 hypothetical protein Gch_089 [Gracilariopsis chorda]AJO68518.1 hypothetical protein [Gracilariopsis lemaneiformis]AML79942.1 hypothetical protein [Gracilariopsis lemaneiformis]AOM66948.1 hypothetical protein Gch_089 [Gracilariopsis chorda]UAD88790.1 hypothetical protein [Gracilariopsis chorda]
MNLTFNYILNISLNTLESFNIKKNDLIPTKWKLILMNDGSFTQNLNSLTNDQIITIPKYTESQYIIKKTKIRNIYLTNNSNQYLAFARSNWILHINHKIHNNLINNQPVGQLFINHQADIYKDIHEIHYVYSAFLEYTFNSIGPVWGRKYTIYYRYQPIITLQEFFSPYLINFF